MTLLRKIGKVIPIICLLLFSRCLLFGQKDTIIKGFYVTKFLKEEISFMFNKRYLNKHKNEFLIDYQENHYLIEIKDSADRLLNNFDNPLSLFNSDDSLYLYDSDYSFYANSWELRDDLSYRKFDEEPYYSNNKILHQLMKLSPFYEMGKDYLYQYIYFECSVIKFQSLFGDKKYIIKDIIKVMPYPKEIKGKLWSPCKRDDLPKKYNYTVVVRYPKEDVKKWIEEGKSIDSLCLNSKKEIFVINDIIHIEQFEQRLKTNTIEGNLMRIPINDYLLLGEALSPLYIFGHSYIYKIYWCNHKRKYINPTFYYYIEEPLSYPF